MTSTHALARPARALRAPTGTPIRHRVRGKMLLLLSLMYALSYLTASTSPRRVRP
jgi:hypothetical protein